MRLYYRIKNFFVYGWDDLRARCQRFKRGWSYGDVWDLDCWFMRNVKPMLEHLLKHHAAYPGGDVTEEDWDAILQEMIDCLTLMDEDAAIEYLGIADDDHTPTSYQRVNALMDEKKDRFFELFSKWFYYLWD